MTDREITEAILMEDMQAGRPTDFSIGRSLFGTLSTREELARYCALTRRVMPKDFETVWAGMEYQRSIVNAIRASRAYHPSSRRGNQKRH